MQQMVLPTYRISEEKLLSTALKGWSAYLTHSAAFQKFSPFYTLLYGELQLQKVNDAFTSFTNKEKNAVLKQLKEQTIILCQHWQLFKRYIQGAYPKRFQASKLKVAGKQYYFNAYRYHFNSAIGLIHDSLNFLNDFKMLLTLEQNMPLTFANEYEAVCDHFKKLLHQYETIKVANKENKYEKIKHLNLIHKCTSEMFHDAKAIFSKDKQVLLDFSFRKL